MGDRPRTRANEAGVHKPVRFADDRVGIIVDGRDIRNGKRRDPWHCAHANACVRQLDGVIGAYIGRTSVYLEHADHFDQYRTPASMRTEIDVFDRNGDFAPGEYELKPVPPSDRQRNSGKRSGRGGGRPTMRHYTVGVRHG